MNVDSSVNISNGHVNAVVSAGNTSVSADVDVNNRNVQSDVQRRNSSVDAQAQVRNGNVHTEVNPHMSVVNDHAQLQNLDYDHAGHIGFQRQLNSDNAGTGISIETDPVTGEVIISNTQTSAEWGNIEGNIEDQTDLTNALNSKQDTLTAGTGITIDADNVISNNVSPLVPAQASIDNQLADKEFVNSSVSTATATYKGNFNVVTDLHLSTSATHQQVATALGNTILVADNNDYCFVEIPTDDLTPTETLQVDRYKYNGSSWSFEYTLNNSGYTSAQWKAINSGITSGKVTQYDNYATSKQDVLTAGSHITINNNVISANITPVFLGKYNLVDDLNLSIGATESQIATALANTITTAVQYDYCLVEIPDYQVYNGYSAFASVDDYVDYYVIHNSAYELVTNANKSSLGIVPKTTVAYILNNAYSVVRYNFNGTDWTSADNSGYANVDASNFTDSGTTFLSGLGMPSNTDVEDITVLASSATYIAPANGWFFAFGTSPSTGNSYIVLIVNNNMLYEKRQIIRTTNNGGRCGIMMPVLAGEETVLSYTMTNVSLRFFYAVGTPAPPQP